MLRTKNLHNIIKSILILCIMIMIGFLLLVFVYFFPTGRIKDNVAKSSRIFDIEGAYPERIPGYEFTKLDNFTDSIMLAIAMYDGQEGVLEKAMSNYRMRSDELGIVKSTTHYANDVDADYYRHAYTRYWHGYLIYVKPLLAFFTYGQIRLLNSIFQLVMMALIVIKMIKGNMKNYILPYVFAVLFLNPATVALSLQYSAIFNLTLVFTLVWLCLQERQKLEEDKIYILFLIAGCVTSYVDFLTYPIAVLGVLSILYLNSYEYNKIMVYRFINNMASWLIGYVGMWAGKWIVGSLVLRENLFIVAMEKIKLRSSSPSVKSGRVGGILENLNVYNDKIFVFLLVSLIAYILYSLARRKVRLEKEHLKMVGLYLGIAVLPFGWMIMASNHVQEHAWFAYRSLSVTVLALGCIYAYIVQNCSGACEEK